MGRSESSRRRRKRRRSRSRDRSRRKKRRASSKDRRRRKSKRQFSESPEPEVPVEKKKKEVKEETVKVEETPASEKETKPAEAATAAEPEIKSEPDTKKPDSKPDETQPDTTKDKSMDAEWKVVKKPKKEDSKEKKEVKKEKNKSKSRSRSKNRRRRRRSKSRERRRKRSRSKDKKPKTEWDELEELARKKKRELLAGDGPRKKTAKELRAEKAQLDKIQRLMKWKAKQQALKENEQSREKFEEIRNKLHADAEKVQQERQTTQQKSFLDSERKWQEQKKDLEKKMEAKSRKRREDREKRAAREAVGGFRFMKRPQKKKMAFGIGKSAVKKTADKKVTVKKTADKKPVDKKNGATKTDTQPRAPPPSAQEQAVADLDPLDAYMNQIAAVQRVDDLRTKKKKGAEVIYSDETVYEEKDLLIENPIVPIKSWTSKKKELKPVDHLAQDYLPFKKNFYIESPDIKAMTDEEVKKYQKESMKGVKIHGQGCPKPIKKWSQCGLPEKVMKTLVRCGYQKPFPVQCQTMPAIMAGRDIIACAKTGSGKTAAFVLPMIRHILLQRVLRNGDGPIGLIIAPTRELSVQIYHETTKFAKSCNLRVAAVYGGAPVSEQIAVLKRGAEIVVCTPGRMIDILCMNQGRVTNVLRVTYIVLDEADRMFDMGFEPQIMSILRQCRPDRQTLLFSATFPRAIEALARQILITPLEIIVGGRSVASEDVIQSVEIVKMDEKFKRILEILGKWYGRGSILIFHDKQEAVDQLFTELQQVGYMALVIHGGVDQFDRENAITDFKNKIKTVMIATSVMSRGLDVKDLKVVINYSSPHHYEDYVHRVGRTGRAGQKGWAYTLMDPVQEIRYAPDILKAMVRAKQDKNIPEELREMAEKFKKKVKDGEEKYFERRGYATRGYKFDEAEAKRKADAKRRQQGVYANPDEIPDVVLSELEKSKIKSEIAKEKMQSLMKNGKEVNPINRQVQAMKKVLEKFKNKNKTGKKNKNKTEATTKSELFRASQKAKKEATKFQHRYTKALADKLFQEEQTKKFSRQDMFTARLDLNDYPEFVRRKMCSNSTINQTKSLCGDRVEIMRRGLATQYGKRPEPGEEPLHLLITADSKHYVSVAQRELCRVLNEAVTHVKTSQYAGSAFNKGPGGRYTVV